MSQPDRPGLKRVITRNMLLLFVIGDMLGAGIYALVGEVGGRVGGAIWVSFLLAAVLAAFTAGAYAELVTKYPQAAGAALYANKAFRKPFVTFLVAFAVMLSGITSASTLSRAFGGDYLGEFVDLPIILVAFAFMIVIAAINYRGIGESVRINIGLTLIEVGGLVLVVVIALGALFAGDAEPSRAVEFTQDESVPLAILGGAGLAFYALIGFEDSVNVAEEAKDPQRDYPRALYGGLFIAGCIYLIVAGLASMVVETKALADSDGPLLEVVQVGPLAVDTKIFAAIALVAVSNTALINMIMASRLVYGMARQGIIPAALGRVDGARGTPIVAIVFTTAIAFVLIATGDLGTLADMTVLLLLCVFVVVNISVLVLRRDPVDHDHFRIPTAIPAAGVVISFAVMTTKDADIFLRAGVLLLVGIALYGLNAVLTGPRGPFQTEELEVLKG
jgi:basic amino acid/polyamine antiporter, APA family